MTCMFLNHGNSAGASLSYRAIILRFIHHKGGQEKTDKTDTGI